MSEQKEYCGPERRHEAHITDEQIEAIAKKAATMAVQQFTDEMYKTVGKTVVSKALTVIGIVAVGFYSLAIAKGWIKL
ncbi:hypothetical protein UFOVP580_11 [uncultured Caudovirales phage]|uniref:Uncharacterized protein n=1 Tax=uncultured Caudovirales phage TaxID=2100421 RepID=A0A6J5PHP4_9CAUD|nr:hypothetical protein UFOVP580_11 [uncultured Caudovirales phage]